MIKAWTSIDTLKNGLHYTTTCVFEIAQARTTYRKLRKVSSRVQKKKAEKRKRNKERNEAKKGLPSS